MTTQAIRKTLMSGLAATFVAAAGTSAYSQPMPCGTHDGVVSRLTEKFKEKQQAIGMVGNKAVVELFVSTDAPDTDFTAKLIDGGRGDLSSGAPVKIKEVK